MVYVWILVGPPPHSSKMWLESHIGYLYFNFSSTLVVGKVSGKKEALQFKWPRLEPKPYPFWSVWPWASPFPLKASFPYLESGNNPTTYLIGLWGLSKFFHVKSLTQKRFFFLQAHNSLNRDCQWVRSKWCSKSLYSSVFSCCIMWWALGKSSQRL